MEELVHKRQNFDKAYQTLKSAYRHFVGLKQHEFRHLIRALEEDGIDYEDEVLRSRDSVIQRFEYTLEVFWKYLRVYLETQNGVMEKVGSKNVVREAVRVRLMTEHEGLTAMDMIETRNLTSHLYRLEVAQMIEAKIPGYIGLMEAIVSRT